MDKFKKIVVGYVTQEFEKNNKGQFVCVRQYFVSGDYGHSYVNDQGDSIEQSPEYEYQPYNMYCSRY